MDEETRGTADNMIELAQHRAMIEIPEDAVELTLHCKIFFDGKLVDVSRTMSMSEIRLACQKADDGYIDEEDTFVLTEKGRKWLEDYESSFNQS